MSDAQYVDALVKGSATIEHRSERVLVAEVKRLRAENLLLAMANADREDMKVELEWFRRLENKLTKHQWYYDYMEENPKPGAGT